MFENFILSAKKNLNSKGVVICSNYYQSTLNWKGSFPICLKIYYHEILF